MDTIPSRAGDLRVQRVDSVDALRHIDAEYDALTRAFDGTCFPVHHRFWIERGARHYLRSRTSLFFLLAWRESTLVGVAPLVREHRSFGIGAMRWLEFWGQHTGSAALDSLTGDFLIPDPEERGPCLTAFRAYLTGPARSEWDGLDLRRFCTISPNLEAFEAVFPEAEGEQEEMPGYLVELSGGLETLSSSFDKKTRQGLRRSMRMLEESGLAHRFAMHETVDAALFEEIAAVHTGRQQELLAKGRLDRDAPFADPATRALIREILDGAAAARMLRVYSLRIDERLAAFGIVLPNAGDAVYWMIGFDGDFQQFSPSRLLFEESYRRESERFGTRRINLLLGFTRTKKELSNREYTSFRFRCANRWSASSRIKRTLYDTAKRLARWLRSVRPGRCAERRGEGRRGVGT